MEQLTIGDIDDINETSTDTINNEETTVIVYAREHYSDDGDDVEDQLKSTLEYVRDIIGDVDATKLWGVTEGDDPRADTLNEREDIRTTATTDTRDTHPDRINAAAQDILDEGVDHLVLQRLDDVADKPTKIDLLVRACEACGTRVHAVEDEFEIPPGPGGDDVRAALAAAARSHNTPDRDDFTDDEGKDDDDKPAHHGRPPVGFDVEDGRLVEGDDYGVIQNALKRLKRGEISIGKASRLTGKGRRTIKRARQKHELYNLNE